jgi:hypothetical protein
MPKMHDYVENFFRTWMIRLRSQIKRNIIQSGDYLEFVDIVQNSQDNLLNPILSDILLEVSRGLSNSNPKAGFGVYLEDIPKLDFLESAMEIFQDSSTVCVMTISESVLLNTQKDLKDFFHEKLEEIVDKEVWDVIDKRWNGYKPNPFNKNGILKAFNQKLPIARVFILMSKILATKLDYHPDGDVWPEAKELGFEEDLIVSQVQTHFLPEWR